jgi:hypothetical protein
MSLLSLVEVLVQAAGAAAFCDALLQALPPWIDKVSVMLTPTACLRRVVRC